MWLVKRNVSPVALLKTRFLITLLKGDEIMRVLEACVCQINYFETEQNYQNYLNKLKEKKLSYKIIDEKRKDDGTVLVKLKRQVTGYNVGRYLD